MTQNNDLPKIISGSCDGLGCGSRICFCDEYAAMANEYQRVTGKEWQLKSGGNWNDPECKSWDAAWRFLFDRIGR